MYVGGGQLWGHISSQQEVHTMDYWEGLFVFVWRSNDGKEAGSPELRNYLEFPAVGLDVSS